MTWSRLLLAPAVLLLAATAPADDKGAPAAELGHDFFSAGASVVLQEPISGDALMAGGALESNASIGGDAAMAGGTVAVRATVGDDLYAAGGQVEVDALVAGNARLAGGRVRILPESRIDGGVAIAGGTVTAEGSFGGYLTIAGGGVTLGGRIDGDVRVYAESLTVLPGTHIGGQLSYHTTDDVTLPDDVVIEGGVAPDGGDRVSGPWRGRGWNPGAVAERIAWPSVAGLFAIGLLLALGLARFSQRTTRVLTGRPWAAMGVGLLVLVCVPAVAAMLFVTLIGIPLAVLLGLVYLAMLIAAYVIGALYLGDRALVRVRPGMPVTATGRLVALLLVLVALGILGGIPLLGRLARLAVLLLGLGGIVLALRRGPEAPPPTPA